MQTNTPSTLVSATLWTLLVFVVGYLLVIGQRLLIPLVLAVFLWYLVNTLAALFARIRIRGRQPPRGVQFLLSGLSLIAVLNLIVSVITSSVGQLIVAAPDYQVNLLRLLSDLSLRFGLAEVPAASQLLGELDFGALIRSIAASFGNLLGDIGLVIVYMLFLGLEQRYFNRKLEAALPDGAQQERVRAILARIDHDVRTYIGIKTMLSAVTSLLSYLVMSWVGLDFAGFWALLIFVLNFIPNVGSLIATAMPSLLALVQFESATPFLIVAIGVGGIQMLVGNALEPNLMGKSLNVSPLAIMLSLVIWGFMWGIPGMFLCVPVTVIGMIVLANFETTRWVALLLSQDGHVKR